MKKQIKYICECCGVDYDTEEEAKKCEARHIKPVKIVRADYKYLSIKRDFKAEYTVNALPISMTVEFENGAEREYFAKGRE